MDRISGGLTGVGLKGWQHGHKHVVQEERAAVHSDGAGQQPAEVADVAGGGGPGLRQAASSCRGRLPSLSRDPPPRRTGPLLRRPRPSAARVTWPVSARLLASHSTSIRLLPEPDLVCSDCPEVGTVPGSPLGYSPALGGLQLRGHLVLTEFSHGESCQRLVCPEESRAGCRGEGLGTSPALAPSMPKPQGRRNQGIPLMQRGLAERAGCSVALSVPAVGPQPTVT